MISLLLVFFALTRSQDLLATVNIYDGYSDEQIESIREERQKEYDEKMEECKKNDALKDFCDTMYASMKPGLLTNENGVESTIKKVDAFTIIIWSHGYTGKIDLGALKGKAAVATITQLGRLSRSMSKSLDKHIKDLIPIAKKVKDDLSIENMVEYHRSIIKAMKDEKATNDDASLSIVGDVKGKVMYLQVTGIIKIVDSPLNVNSFACLLGGIAKYSEKINVKYFTTDIRSFKTLNFEKITTDQFFITFFASNYDDYDYKGIKYNIYSWNILYGNSENGLKEISDFSLPYSAVSSFGIWTSTLYFFISRTKDVNEIKNLNLSVGISTARSSLLDVPKQTIKVKTDSLWENSDIKPTIYVTADKKLYTVDDSESSLKVEQKEPYVAEPPKKKNNVGLIVGIVVAVVVVIVIVVVVVIIVRKKKAANGGSSNEGKAEDA